MDPDLTVLEEAAAAVTAIDRKYRRANFNEQIELKPERDEAFNTYARARLKLLEEGVIATEEDVEQMKRIRREVARARKTQTLIAGALRLARFLAKFV